MMKEGVTSAGFFPAGWRRCWSAAGAEKWVHLLGTCCCPWLITTSTSYGTHDKNSRDCTGMGSIHDGGIGNLIHPATGMDPYSSSHSRRERSFLIAMQSDGYGPKRTAVLISSEPGVPYCEERPLAISFHPISSSKVRSHLRIDPYDVEPCITQERVT